MTQNETPDISQEQVTIPTIVREAAVSAQLGDIPNFAVFRKLVDAMLQRYQHPSSVKKRNRRCTRKPHGVQ